MSRTGVAFSRGIALFTDDFRKSQSNGAVRVLVQDYDAVLTVLGMLAFPAFSVLLLRDCK